MYSSHVQEFEQYVKSKLGNDDEEGPIVKEKYTEHVCYLKLGDTVTTCYGGAHFREDKQEIGLYHFDVSLGPANAKKLVEFLLAMEDEPESD